MPWFYFTLTRKYISAAFRCSDMQKKPAAITVRWPQATGKGSGSYKSARAPEAQQRKPPLHILETIKLSEI